MNEGENTSVINETNVNINIYGTVNGNVAGSNSGILTASILNCPDKKEGFEIRPNIDESSKESHRYIKDAFAIQKDGDINDIIELLQKAINAELHECNPDSNTIAFSRYLLVHYLLTDSRNDKAVIPLINDILKTENIEKDVKFYCNVLLEKAHALCLNNEIKKARAIINIVDEKLDDKHREESIYLQIVGQLTFLEGNVDDAILILSKGKDNALSQYVIATSEEEQFTSCQHYFAFLTCLGEVYRLIHRPDLARSLWENAVDAADKIGWSQEKVRPLFGLIECLIQYEEYDNADMQLENIHNIIRDDNNSDLLKQYYYLKSVIYLQCKDNQWRKAIECLKNILQQSESPDEKVRILRTIADIQASHGDIDKSLQSLEQAKCINIENGFMQNNDTIEVQLEDIKKSAYFVDGQVRHSPYTPSQSELRLMEVEYNKCENAIHSLSLSLDIGLGYIDINSNYAFDWLGKTYKKAYKMQDNLIAAQALIGQACILFRKQMQKSEEVAQQCINSAVEMIESIPMWEIRARAKMFQGMAIAHKEDFKEAYQLFVEAKEIVESHNVRDQYLNDLVSNCVDECKYILSKNKFTDIDFDTVIEEINFLKCWYPKYTRNLLHFLWYNRHEDIEKLLIASPESKAFLVSDKTTDVLEWCDALGALFDIFTFSSETDYHTNKNWKPFETVPIPENMASKFLNIFVVLNPK